MKEKARTIRQTLESMSKASLKIFNERIIPSDSEVLGVKIPDVRAYAKTLCEKPTESLASISPDSFEEIMLFGLIVGLADLPYDKRLIYLDRYLDLADNWAHIDCAVSTYKFIKASRSEFLKVIEKNLFSDNEFRIRFAVVCLLDYYLDEEYIDRALLLTSKADTSYYYVSMAVAWLYSVAYIKCRDKAINHLNHTKIDDLTYNRTISKICDSLRVGKEDKEKLKTTKRKN